MIRTQAALHFQFFGDRSLCSALRRSLTRLPCFATFNSLNPYNISSVFSHFTQNHSDNFRFAETINNYGINQRHTVPCTLVPCVPSIIIKFAVNARELILQRCANNNTINSSRIPVELKSKTIPPSARIFSPHCKQILDWTLFFLLFNLLLLDRVMQHIIGVITFQEMYSVAVVSVDTCPLALRMFWPFPLLLVQYPQLPTSYFWH